MTTTTTDMLTRSDRATLASQLETLRTPSEESEAAAAEAREAEAEVERLKDELEAAKIRRNTAKAKAATLGGIRSREAERIRRELRRSAEPCVEDLKAWARDVEEELRSSAPRFRHDPSQRVVGKARGPVVGSDKPSRERRFAYLARVLRGSESLVQQAAEIVDPKECAEFCEQVRADLPPLKIEPTR